MPPIDKVLEQGGLFAVLILGLCLLFRIGLYVSKRILDPAEPSKGNPGGLLVQYFNTHKEFLAGLEQRDKTQLEVVDKHTELLETIHKDAYEHAVFVADTLCGLTKLVKDPDSDHLSTTVINKTIVDAAKIELLKQNINEATPPAEIVRVREEIDALLRAVQKRHEERLALAQSLDG